MNEISIEKVYSLLKECNVMSLATCEDNIPWAASVFFVADDTFNLYFVSGQSSRHSRNAATNSMVAVTINKDHSDWFTISGLQIEGLVSISPAQERERILALYLGKFPNLSGLRDNPSNEQEKLIVDRLMASDFYQLKPGKIRLIDNSMSFGFKTEIKPSDWEQLSYM
jgi:uncharacterized protein YhbP (UPF0306 family)